ncbi:MAG: hypothetical protein AAF802_01755 [Planctomycetota bacterium]
MTKVVIEGELAEIERIAAGIAASGIEPEERESEGEQARQVLDLLADIEERNQRIRELEDQAISLDEAHEMMKQQRDAAFDDRDKADAKLREANEAVQWVENDKDDSINIPEGVLALVFGSGLRYPSIFSDPGVAYGSRVAFIKMPDDLAEKQRASLQPEPVEVAPEPEEDELAAKEV